MFPIEFPDCPLCHSKDTVCRLACADESSIPKEAFPSLEKCFTPIQDVAKISTSTVRGILCHYDVCADCGLRYCTRAELKNMPVEIRYSPLSPGPIKGDLK